MCVQECLTTPSVENQSVFHKGLLKYVEYNKNQQEQVDNRASGTTVRYYTESHPITLVDLLLDHYSGCGLRGNSDENLQIVCANQARVVERLFVEGIITHEHITNRNIFSRFFGRYGWGADATLDVYLKYLPPNRFTVLDPSSNETLLHMFLYSFDCRRRMEFFRELLNRGVDPKVESNFEKTTAIGILQRQISSTYKFLAITKQEVT